MQFNLPAGFIYQCKMQVIKTLHLQDALFPPTASTTYGYGSQLHYLHQQHEKWESELAPAAELSSGLHPTAFWCPSEWDKAFRDFSRRKARFILV